MNFNRASDSNQVSSTTSRAVSKRISHKTLKSLTEQFDSAQNKSYPKVNTIEHAHRVIEESNQLLSDSKLSKQASLDLSMKTMSLQQAKKVIVTENDSLLILNPTLETISNSQNDANQASSSSNQGNKINSWKIRFKKFYQFHRKFDSAIKIDHIIDLVGDNFLEVDNQGSTFWQGILFQINTVDDLRTNKFYLELFKKFCDQFNLCLENNTISQQQLKKLLNHNFETQDDILTSLIKNKIAHRVDHSDNSLLKRLVSLGADQANAVNYVNQEMLRIDKILEELHTNKTEDNSNFETDDARQANRIKKILSEKSFLKNALICMQDKPFSALNQKQDTNEIDQLGEQTHIETEVLFSNPDKIQTNLGKSLLASKPSENKHKKSTQNCATIIEQAEDESNLTLERSNSLENRYSSKRSYSNASLSVHASLNSLVEKNNEALKIKISLPVKNKYKNVSLDKIEKIVEDLGIKDPIFVENSLEKNAIPKISKPIPELRQILLRYKPEKKTRFITALERSSHHFNMLSQKFSGRESLIQLEEALKDAKEATRNGEILNLKDKNRTEELVQFSQDEIFDNTSELSSTKKTILKKFRTFSRDMIEIGGQITAVLEGAQSASSANNYETKNSLHWQQAAIDLNAASSVAASQRRENKLKQDLSTRQEKSTNTFIEDQKRKSRMIPNTYLPSSSSNKKNIESTVASDHSKDHLVEPEPVERRFERFKTNYKHDLKQAKLDSKIHQMQINDIAKKSLNEQLKQADKNISNAKLQMEKDKRSYEEIEIRLNKLKEKNNRATNLAKPQAN